jgi:hypothetical protein
MITGKNNDDGETTTTYCNARPPPPGPIFASPTAVLRFHSDAGGSGRGFRLRYRTVCERTFTASRGTMFSVNIIKIKLN